MNYHFSKDYELLWELAQKQEVICAINDRLVKARKEHDNTVLVAWNGFCYLSTDNKNHFIDACKHYKVQFLIPGETEELVGALKNIIVAYDFYFFPDEYLAKLTSTEKAKELLKKYEVKG